MGHLAAGQSFVPRIDDLMIYASKVGDANLQIVWRKQPTDRAMESQCSARNIGKMTIATIDESGAHI